MNRACATALAALVLCSVAPAAAQDQLVTTFVPDAQRRWDAAWFVGWRGVDKSEVAPEWDEWYDVAAFSASAGHYLTPHVKIDLDVSTTTTGRVTARSSSGFPAPFPSLPAPVVRIPPYDRCPEPRLPVFREPMGSSLPWRGHRGHS